MRGGNERFLRFHLLRCGRGNVRLAGRDLFFDAAELALLLGGRLIEPRGFGFVLAKFALEGERAGFALAAAGNHAAVIAGAIGRQEITVRIVAGHLLGDGRRFDEIGGAKLLEEIFRRRPERLAEFDEACRGAR